MAKIGQGSMVPSVTAFNTACLDQYIWIVGVAGEEIRNYLSGSIHVFKASF